MHKNISDYEYDNGYNINYVQESSMAENTETVEQVAYQYGREVAWREYCSDMGNLSDFEESDRACRRLWQKLIEMGAYQDAENSVLRDEIRPHYENGLEQGYPDVEDDWEEYWEGVEDDD